MPDAAEVVLLVLELADLDDLAEAGNALHERILDRLSHAAGERHELRRVELLVTEKDHAVLEKRRANFPLGKVPGEIDAEDLRAERARDAPHFHLERPGIAAAVHEQILPGNEARLGAAQEGAGVAELLDG